MPPLGHHGLRLPDSSLQRLQRLTADLQAPGLNVTAGSITRGLCLLALELARGAAGAQAAFAFHIAMCDPTSIGAYRALKAFRALLIEEIEPLTVPMRHDHDEPQRPPEDLRGQALRLPLSAQTQVEELVRAQRALGFDASRGGVTRGLCMLALLFASGEAGSDVARAASIAMDNPTPEGARHAVEVLRLLLEQDLPTRRDLRSFTEPTSDPTPPTFPSACAA